LARSLLRRRFGPLPEWAEQRLLDAGTLDEVFG
jgi:hypothetical protein